MSLKYIANHPRGFLQNYPDDVIRVINGVPITKSDILDGKWRMQARKLDARRRPTDNVTRACFVWVFYNGNRKRTHMFFPFGGWYIYIRTLDDLFCLIGSRDDHKFEGRERGKIRIVQQIMQIHPTGHLPIADLKHEWATAFCDLHQRPTKKRPYNNGLAPAWAELTSDGKLLNVIHHRPPSPRTLP